jgi:hypothetical protein
MVLEPGDVLVLSSAVFHTSAPNATGGDSGRAPQSRRVHMAQYSRGVVRWEPPLCQAYLYMARQRGSQHNQQQQEPNCQEEEEDDEHEDEEQQQQQAGLSSYLVLRLRPKGDISK